MDLNQCTFIGKVVDVPKIATGGDGKKVAFLELLVNNRVQDANNQWVNQPIKVPVLIKEPRVNSVEQYVGKDQELTITGYYQTWMQQDQLRHCFIATNMSFGYKPKGDAAHKADAQGPSYPI